VLSDEDLLAAIRHDLKAIYSDIIRQPLPDELAAALKRLEARNNANLSQSQERPWQTNT
jgi:hypothetical protein